MIAVLSIPLAAVAGAWLHELTHAVAAVVVGGRVERIDLLRLGVVFEVPTGLREDAVRWAPFVSGLLVLPALALIPSPWLPAAGLGWAVFALLGGEREPGVPLLLNRLRRSTGRREKRPDGHSQAQDSD